MSEPIRILHVLQRMETGGTQSLLMNLYRNIDRTKVQFDFLVEYPEKQFYDDEIISLGGKVYYSTIREDYNILKFRKYLKQILLENEYKIIHVHAYTIGYICLKTAKECNIPIRIAHSHNNQTTKDRKYFIKKIMQKMYTIYATDLFACSEEAGKYLYKEKRFKVLNNSIDSKKFVFNENIRKKVRNELKINDDTFLIGHVGRLHNQKNHKFLLKIFYEIKKINKKSKLLLVGDGPLEKEIKNQVNELNLQDNVIFLKNRADVNELYMGMDVFILPSLFEGLGIVAVEAQAAGTPCLTSDTLPKEADVSPLYERLSLDKSPKIWAEEAIKISESKYAHQNMQKYIIEHNYDIMKSSKEMEKFYIEKLKY